MPWRVNDESDLPPRVRKLIGGRGGEESSRTEPPKRAAGKSELVEYAKGVLRAVAPDLGSWEAEYHFALETVPGINPRRRLYRLDLALPLLKLGVEVHGATYGTVVECHACGVKVRARKRDGSLGGIVRTGGYHTQGVGFDVDRKKMGLALALGWSIIEVTGPMLRASHEWVGWIRAIAGRRKGERKR